MKKIPLAENTPRQLQMSDVGEFGELDVRVSAVTVIFGSVIGVNDGHISWCPDDMPPSEQERLAWIWLCNPSLDTKILPLAVGLLHDLIAAYRSGEMDRWWMKVASD